VTGTLINAAAIVTGTLIGLTFGKYLSDRTQETLNTILGIFTIALGLNFFIQSKDFFPVLVCCMLGGFAGEAIGLESRLEKLFARAGGAFTTSSLVFCIGSMAILGSLEEGVSGTYEILNMKSMIDFFTAIVLTLSLGMFVMFSSLSVLVYQGSLSLLSKQLSFLQDGSALPLINGVGGICLFMIGLNFFGYKKARTANLIPAVLFAFGWGWIKTLI
jgi:uncharacterized membrane protein YqgA involved in biofilm formation